MGRIASYKDFVGDLIAKIGLAIGIAIVFMICSATLVAAAPGPTDVPNLVTEFGSQGSGDGQFAQPRDIAISNDGYVYIADTFNFRIQKFDLNGNYIGQWGEMGNGDGQFLNLGAIDVDPDGNIYVLDHDRIQKFDSAGNFIMKWSPTAPFFGSTMAIDSEGYVYVANNAGPYIQKFDSAGSLVTQWGSSGSGDGQFYFPNTLTFSEDDTLYISDPGNGRVQTFNTSGTYLSQFSNTSSASANSLLVSKEYLYIIQYGSGPPSDTLQKFSLDGSFLVEWGGDSTFISNDGIFQGTSGPLSIDADSYGNIYVLGYDQNKVFKFAYPNEPPLPSPDNIMTEPGTPVTFSILANDTDPDGDQLFITEIDGQSITPGQTITLSDGSGSLRLNSDMTVTFTPVDNFSGQTSFSYVVSDGTDTRTGTVTILVELSSGNNTDPANSDGNDAVSDSSTNLAETGSSHFTFSLMALLLLGGAVLLVLAFRAGPSLAVPITRNDI
jgi:hypothetical protein